MYQHMILMCSDYNMSRRIAFHKSYKNITSILEFQKTVDLLKDSFRNVTFSFHHIVTESRAIESVIDYDSYFKDVDFYSDMDNFRKNIEQSVEITPNDMIKYILTKREFDQLQIQKLLFYMYVEYAKEHDKPLFKDIFEAWKYGPVIPKVYYDLNGYEKNKIKLEDKELELIKLKLKLSRVYDRESILQCIDRVIDKYGNKTGGQLIDETHKKGSPWDITIKGYGSKSEIPFNLIRDYARKA